MPGYRSNPGGLFNSGVQPSSRPQVDLGGLLEAVGAGTGSIIHSMMARRMAENQLATQQQELALRQGEAKRAAEHDTWQRGMEEKKLAQQGEAQRRQDMINGLVQVPGSPASDETSQVPITPLAAPTVPQSPIARAAATRGMPGPQLTPSAATATAGPQSQGTIAPTAPPMTATVHNPQVAQAERTEYHPDQALSVVAAQTRADAALDVATKRAASAEAIADKHITAARNLETQRQTGRMAAIGKAGELAKERQRIANEGKTNGPMGRAMTQAQKDKVAVDDATGFLSAYVGGTYDDALDVFNNTPQGQALQKNGVTEDHLLRAFGKLKRDPDTGRILGLVQSGAAIETEKGKGDAVDVAAKMVKDAKKAGAPPKATTGPRVAPVPGVTPVPGTPPDTAKPKLGARTKSDTLPTVVHQSIAAWKRDNPQKKDETPEQWYARYAAANPVKK